MIKGDYDELKGVIKMHRCPEHNNPLALIWNEEAKSYVIRCGAGHFPEEVTRQPSLTELHKQGVELPEPIKSNVEKGIRTRAAKAERQSTAVTFTGIPATDLGTGELLPPVVIQGLIAYAERYHLDPARGHVCLMHGKPYITIDGYLYHANKSKRPYTLDSKPIKKEEFQLFQISEGAHAWLSTVKFTDTGAYKSGIGIVTREEMTAKSHRDAGKLRSPVVAAHPWQLAQKRAEWQALRRAFPIGETDEERSEA